jgi:hypothetical protein
VEFHENSGFVVTEKMEPVESGGVESHVAVINHSENHVERALQLPSRYANFARTPLRIRSEMRI